MKIKKIHQQGSVLFIVLVVIIALVTMVAISAMKMETDIHFTQTELEKLRAYTMCVSGMEYIKNRLATGLVDTVEITQEDNTPFSPRLYLDSSDITLTFKDMIQYPFNHGADMAAIGQMGFIINLQDSAGLINVFQIDRSLFKQLLAHHGIEKERGDIFLDSLLDWMDTDDLIRPNGAESNYYHKQNERFNDSPPNRMIDSHDELRLVRGMDNHLFNTIAHLLDFTITNQGINPNTMPKETFFLFNGLDEEKIERIINKRREKPIETLGDLTFISGYNFSSYPNTFQFFTSSVTYVKIKARMNDNHFYFIEYELERVGAIGSMRKGTDGLQLLNPQGPRQHYNPFNEYFETHAREEGTIHIPPQNKNNLNHKRTRNQQQGNPTRINSPMKKGDHHVLAK